VADRLKEFTMTDALPKIWNTTFTDHSENIRDIEYRIPSNTPQHRIVGSQGFLYPDGKPPRPELVPGTSPVAQEDVLAVRADAAQGADLWIDANYRSCIFLSDRLKSALKPAGIRVQKMPLRPCTVIA
jgi:hypothetical protein